MSRKIVRVLGIARGSVEFDDGDKWEGEFVDGKPGGHGKHTCSDGGVYEGEWANGKPNGVGKMNYAAGKKLEYCDGEWVNGKQHGYGTMKWRDGHLYAGHFQNGKRHGNGKYTWSNGDVYVGEFHENKCHGNGTYTSADGSVYVGEWLNGKMHGRGKMAYSNGNVYEGEFQRDKIHGNGTVKYANGTSYTGEWLNGKMHGNGILKLTDGDELKQEYKHGELLSSKRVATLTNVPPSQRPRIGNAVNDMFLLNEDYTTCDICMERFSFDRNTEDEDAKKRLPVLSKTCDHWFCHGCILGEQTRRAGLAEDGASPTWIPCMKCRSEAAFCPSEPRYDRRLIDMLSSSIPVREERSTVVERDD